MRTRPITVFAVALALLAALAPAARAQDGGVPPDVQEVYNDYRMDGKINVCDHQQATLEKTRDTIKPDFDRDYPDFREAVEAGIDKHKDGGCGGDDSSDSSGSSGGGVPPAATSTPDAGATAAPPAATVTPESGKLPEASPTPEATVPPEDAIPPQTGTPVPTVPPAAPAVTPAPSPRIVHAGHRSLTLPIVLIVIALLGLVALALSWLLAQRNPRVRRAWREAAFRTRGTWADFSDWLRLGR